MTDPDAPATPPPRDVWLARDRRNGRWVVTFGREETDAHAEAFDARVGPFPAARTDQAREQARAFNAGVTAGEPVRVHALEYRDPLTSRWLSVRPAAAPTPV